MKQTGKINYIEMPSTDLAKTKQFFASVFGWSFIDYGPNYVGIDQAGIDGGFYTSDKVSTTDNGSVLVILYSDELETTLAEVEAAGGAIVEAIFSFPGGRRFHFTDPSGNEFAVWSEPAE